VEVTSLTSSSEKSVNLKFEFRLIDAIHLDESAKTLVVNCQSHRNKPFHEVFIPHESIYETY